LTILQSPRASLDDGTESLAARLPRNWAALFHLAWPVVLSRAGLVLLVLTAIVLVGRYDTVALAHLSLGNAIFFPLVVTGVGAMVGIISQTSREKGAGSRDLPAIFLRGMSWALVVGGAISMTFTVVSEARDEIRETAVIARITSLNSTAAVTFGDSRAAAEILSALRANPHVITAAIRQACSGALLANGRTSASAPSSACAFSVWR
jgi:hypothetical protein